jgi:C4-dicarboxylate transporter DctM subunit
MSLTVIGIMGLVLLVILLFLRMPVGFVMGLLGFLGVSYVQGLEPGLAFLARDVFEVFSLYGLTVLPLILFMDQVAFHSAMGRRLYDSALAVLGRGKGGAAMAAVAAAAGFSAVSASTTAPPAAMAGAALPEMGQRQYDPGLAAGTVAGAGSLGIIVPPGIILILYGILTKQPIGKLFVAGICPGILLSLLFLLAVYVRVSNNPSLAPPGPRVAWRERAGSFMAVLEALVIFGLVVGGLFFRVFNPTEAAAAGACVILLFAVAGRHLTWQGFIQTLADTTQISCRIMVVAAGAVLFGHFMAVTQVPRDLAGWAGRLPLPGSAIMGGLLLIYLFAGCFMDALAMILLAIPILFPLSRALGIDPIWFGIMLVLVTGIGAVTPPVGINAYVVLGTAGGVMGEIPLASIFRGSLPFVLATIGAVIILMIFPQIILFLPNLMY